MNGRTFYDVHMHAFNLSHPSLLSFLRRQIREISKSWLTWRKPWRLPVVVLLAVAFPLLILLLLVLQIPGLGRMRASLAGGIKRFIYRALNLLNVMENDLGSIFFLIENCLRQDGKPLEPGDRLRVGGETYDRIVLTPLMMDFGYKGKSRRGAKRRFRYDVPASKPIVAQVIDVFNAIRKYTEEPSPLKLPEESPTRALDTQPVFEIYPFLGITPKNYSPADVKELLDKYFSNYSGTGEELREKLFANLGKFTGNIEELASYFFAGIKVYPPLGFDPWPEEEGVEREKVKLIYDYCVERNVPITTHGGKGGFVVVPRPELKQNTSLSRWETVLEKYPALKLNLAHFPARGKRPSFEWRRRVATLKLVLGAENVYVDISCRATNEQYYEQLRGILDGYSSEKRDKLTSRILFGTDFSVNLMSVDSYSGFVNLFSETEYLTDDEKLAFCSVNPERFLFG